MAVGSISDHVLSIKFVEVCDSEGRLWLGPETVVNDMLATGRASIAVTMNMQPGKPARPWLTVTESARLHLTDMRPATDDADADELLKLAKKRISRACDGGKIRSDETGFKRRIDPESLDAWRLMMRERDLAADGDPA